MEARQAPGSSCVCRRRKVPNDAAQGSRGDVPENSESPTSRSGIRWGPGSPGGCAGSDALDLLGLRALRALSHVELDLLALLQLAVATALDGRVVNEDIGAAAVLLDEAEALFAVEPLHGACCHWCCLFWLARPPVWRPQVAGAHDERVARTFARPPIRAESVLHGPGRQLGTTVAVAVVPRLRSGRGLLHFSVPSRSRGPAAGMRWALLQSPGAEGRARSMPAGLPWNLHPSTQHPRQGDHDALITRPVPPSAHPQVLDHDPERHEDVVHGVLPAPPTRLSHQRRRGGRPADGGHGPPQAGRLVKPTLLV